MTQPVQSFAASLQHAFSQFWQARQERERSYLIVAALFSVLSLVYLIALGRRHTSDFDTQYYDKKIILSHRFLVAMVSS